VRDGGGMGWEVRARKVRLAKINPNRARSCPWVTASDSILVDSACARKLELEACAQSSDSGDDALRSVAPWAAANGCSYPVAIRRVLNDSRHCLCEIRDCVHAERGRRMRAKRCSPSSVHQRESNCPSEEAAAKADRGIRPRTEAATASHCTNNSCSRFRLCAWP
jgi:hypothetical protein